jgi:hypothetical protein
LISSLRTVAPPLRYSLLHDEREAVLALKGIIELDQVHMAELIHDVDLILHILLWKQQREQFPTKLVRKRSQQHPPRQTDKDTLPPAILLQ